MYFKTECLTTVQRHPSSLILMPIETTNFLLVVNSILLCFNGIASFLLKTATPLGPIHPNFWDVPLGLLDRGCRAPGSEYHKLIIRVITLELT